MHKIAMKTVTIATGLKGNPAHRRACSRTATTDSKIGRGFFFGFLGTDHLGGTGRERRILGSLRPGIEGRTRQKAQKPGAELSSPAAP